MADTQVNTTARKTARIMISYSRKDEVFVKKLYNGLVGSGFAGDGLVDGNDPGCSGGFGMGMSMYLGPKLIEDPESVLRSCGKLPTRFRD